MEHRSVSRMPSTDVNGDWVGCVDWLVRCQVMTSEHRAAQPNAHLTDLAHALRDGVILCSLVNRLQPKSIDLKDFSQRPQMSQFLCVKNIRTFLAACKSVFGMKDCDLFEPSDLFDLKDISKVLSTLCTLANSPAALASQFEPFTLDESNYINVTDVLNGDEGEEEQDDYDHYIDTDDDIYGDLVAIKRMSVLKQDNSTLPKSKRDMVIKEIVDTERNYVNCLKMLVEEFMKPLKDLLDTTDFKKIFNQIETLFEIHSKFCEDLVKASGPAEDNPNRIAIADCFIMNKEKFLIYGDYCSHLINAQERLDQICLANPMVQQKIVDLQIKANENKFRLRDMLSVPMQRVLKYHLLLQELVRQTEDHNPDKKSLKIALEETQDLSLCVNEVKRDNEALNALSLLQKSITDLPRNLQNLKAYGRLQMDGELRVRCKYSSDKRHVFVLDQIMLICKTRPGDHQHMYVSSIDLKGFELNEASLTKDWSMGFLFAMVDTKTNEHYTFGVKKEEIRRKWLDAIKMAQENISPPFARSAKHNFKMWSFAETTICDFCRKLLRGVFYQGYRCQDENCNMAVHKECLSKAREMSGPPTKLPPKLSVGTSFKKPVSVSPMPSIRQLTKGKVIASSNYDGDPHPGTGRTPLIFQRNDEIEVLWEDGDWCEGELGRSVGFFPRSHVRRPPVSSPLFSMHIVLYRCKNFRVRSA